jgi:ssDNA-binding Zn-finger/Zn-ribbon topoisomerase 1
MPRMQVKVKCPKCGLMVEAQLEAFRDFILYQCPKCKNNVAVMDNKTMIISKELFKSLVTQGIFETCGKFSPMILVKKNKEKSNSVHSISQDDILNLRILLETETDFSKILSKL